MHQAMDWFSWLSKTRLEPPFIHEYAVTFSHNQLEEEDISYFNHEFLQSMGISIAKHRLEILKLARGSGGSHPMAKLMMAVKKTKRSLATYVRTWVHRHNHSALVMVKKRSYSSRWKGAILKRNNRLVQGSATLFLTNGNQPVVRSGGARVNSFSSPLIYDLNHDHDHDQGRAGGGESAFSDDEDGGYWSSTRVEEIKWDAMFQNLKPT